MSVTLLTFGGGSKRYYDAITRLVNQAKSFPFDKIIAYSDLDLEQLFPDFWLKHQNFMINNKRGFGYWIWKPYIILQTLKQMKKGDILLYLDCGCELNIKGLKRFEEYIEMVKKNQRMLFHLEDKHSELVWNKMDLIDFMNIKDQSILSKPQAESGMQFYLCNNSNIKLIEEYYNICCNYNLIDDTPSKLANLSSFIEHRHDQSVLSLLFKKYKYFTLLDETYPDTMPNQNNKHSYPIWAIRNYSSESKL